MKPQSILISGAGSGMGLLMAQTLVSAGHRVYAGVRDPQGRNVAKADLLYTYARQQGKQVTVVDLDVLSEESCQKAVAQVVTDANRLDVVIHNAAHLFIGLTEGFTAEQLMDSLNTNAVGAHRLNRAALPTMRKQGSGLLLYIGSTITSIVIPFVTPYTVAKHAMDALAEGTAFELRPLGIETTILMPGLFKDGTLHFATAVPPQDEAVVKEYGSVLADYQDNDRAMRQLFIPDVEVPVQGVADEAARVIALPAGERPFRTVVDYTSYGAEPLIELKDQLTDKVMATMGLSHMLKVNTAAQKQ